MLRFLFIFLFPIFAFCKTIEVVPSSHNEVHTLFKQPLEKEYARLGLLEKIQYKLLALGHSIQATDLNDIPRRKKKFLKLFKTSYPKKGIDKIFVMNMPYYLHSQKIFNLPKEKLILFMLEPPTICPIQYRKEKMQRHFHKIYTFDDDLVDNKTFFKFYYPVRNQKNSEKVPFDQKRLVCMISANKSSTHPNELYSERREAIEFFERYPDEDFTLYGYDWGRENYKNYSGVIDNKIETLKHFKFSICYENMENIRGYVTEKIFDCLMAGCIPIYLGASNIQEYVAADCFIDKRDFSSYEELLSYLKNMSQETYQGYIDRINLYLKSQMADRFDPENFINLFVQEASS